MEEQIKAAVAAHDLPGVVLLATSKDGKFTYSNAIGNLSLKEADDAKSITIHSPMWIASCTKLFTSIAALQCIEKGLLDLESDVTTILPELGELKILTGFDADGQPIFKERKTPITLHHLLTHSSGLAYDLFNVEMMKWRKSQGMQVAPGSTVLSRYLCPLIYEPGTDWEYSPSIDFIGMMVARVTTMPLQEYMEKHIWEPIGIKDMTFSLKDRPDLKAEMPKMSYRDAESGKAVWKDVPPATPNTEAMGGGGLYARPSEYLKVLHAILKNDGTLLKPETVDDMFKPHLTPESAKGLAKVLATPEFNIMLGALPEQTSRNWGWGGLLLLTDIKDWRRKGTLTWGGMPNLIWWIDREAGLCGLYASQILPPGDLKSVQMSILFEKAMYERYAKEQSRL